MACDKKQIYFFFISLSINCFLIAPNQVQTVYPLLPLQMTSLLETEYGLVEQNQDI